MSTTTNIQSALAGITYSSTLSYTTVTRFQNHDVDFEDFTNFPAIVVVDGDEDNEPLANGVCLINYHPEVHFYGEGQTAANMTAWRESIRDAIYGDATLESHAIDKRIDSITVDESEDRKLQHMAFYLTITIDRTY